MECAYCGHRDGRLVPASLQPGTSLYMCADDAACVARLDEINAATPI